MKAYSNDEELGKERNHLLVVYYGGLFPAAIGRCARHALFPRRSCRVYVDSGHRL